MVSLKRIARKAWDTATIRKAADLADEEIAARVNIRYTKDLDADAWKGIDMQEIPLLFREFIDTGWAFPVLP